MDREKRIYSSADVAIVRSELAQIASLPLNAVVLRNPDGGTPTSDLALLQRKWAAAGHEPAPRDDRETRIKGNASVQTATAVLAGWAGLPADAVVFVTPGGSKAHADGALSSLRESWRRAAL